MDFYKKIFEYSKLTICKFAFNNFTAITKKGKLSVFFCSRKLYIR